MYTVCAVHTALLSSEKGAGTTRSAYALRCTPSSGQQLRYAPRHTARSRPFQLGRAKRGPDNNKKGHIRAIVHIVCMYCGAPQPGPDGPRRHTLLSANLASPCAERGLCVSRLSSARQNVMMVIRKRRRAVVQHSKTGKGGWADLQVMRDACPAGRPSGR